MKNLITILTITTLTISAAFASTTPEVLISSADIEVVNVENLDIFTMASFDTASENLVFDTKSEMSVVQIFDPAGNMLFQLPVMSDNVQINKNLFESGTFKLGFVMAVSYTHLTLPTTPYV